MRTACILHISTHMSMDIKHVVVLQFTYPCRDTLCELKGDGASANREYYSGIDVRPTSGPKYCPRPGRKIYFSRLLSSKINLQSFQLQLYNLLIGLNIAEPLFPRHLVVGGDDDNLNLWMSDNKGETWRKSVILPYGPGLASYGASLFQREGKVK